MVNTVEYPYVNEGSPEIGEWTGDETEAIRAAEGHFRAQLDGDAWVYHDEATGEDYRVDRHGMLAAGAAILDGRPDWYSYWCTYYGEPA